MWRDFVIFNTNNSPIWKALNYELKEGKESNDIYRHCFYNEKTDSMFDYDEYDLISIISVWIFPSTSLYLIIKSGR